MKTTVRVAKKCAASNIISNIENKKPENSYSHPKPFSSSTLEMNENYFSPQNNFSPQPSQVHSTTEDFNLKVEDVRTLLPAYMKNLCATISPLNENASNVVGAEINECNTLTKETCKSMQELSFEEKLQIIENHPEKIIQAQPTKNLK